MILKIKDSDTGETGMDVVPVPEGFSFQVYDHNMQDYISVIVSPRDCAKLINYLQGTVGGYERPKLDG